MAADQKALDRKMKALAKKLRACAEHVDGCCCTHDHARATAASMVQAAKLDPEKLKALIAMFAQLIPFILPFLK